MPHYHVVHTAGNDRRIIAAAQTSEEALGEVRLREGPDFAARFETTDTVPLNSELDERLSVERVDEPCDMVGCKYSR